MRRLARDPQAPAPGATPGDDSRCRIAVAIFKAQRDICPLRRIHQRGISQIQRPPTVLFIAR